MGEPDKQPSDPPGDWTKLLPEALERMHPQEQILVRRLAEARGRRVSIKELTNTFGLPPAPSLAYDFPGLSEFVTARKQSGQPVAMPVVASGDDEKGWYWMAPTDSSAFRMVLQTAEEGKLAHASDQEARPSEAGGQRTSAGGS